MSVQRHQRVSELFLKVCDLEPHQRRAALDLECPDDAAMRDDVLALADGDRRSAGFLEGSGVGSEFVGEAVEQLLDDLRLDQVAEHPTTIGRYRILDVLGEGGMGTVYKAEQDHPRRTVALKMIRRGVTSPRILGRFEHEAQLLGRLQHPGIAQIYETGTVKAHRGCRPFFAMEFVDGCPITEYAEQAHLSIRQRLQLLARIGLAVHHAHQKGVIHRDLKPGNILVDASGQPKIVDFGVARATEPDSTVATMHTIAGQLVGTIPYMSPEQVGGRPDQIDTRSDVYALGVVGYELLSGRLPYDLIGRSIAESARIIECDTPARLGEVNRAFRGDVETIFAKALEKDKQQRYQSAADFAADIRRYLDNEPVIARPATTLYQLRKFARRNPALVGAIAVAFVVLIAATAVSLAFWQQSVADKMAAQRRADHLEAVSWFLKFHFLEAPFPWRDGDAVTIVERIDQAARELDTAFTDQPLTEAFLRHSVGNVYQELGRYDDAEVHLRRARDLWIRTQGPDAEDTLATTDWLVRLLRRQGRLDEAERLIGDAARRANSAFGENHHVTLNMRRALGLVQWDLGRRDQARRTLRDVWRRLRRHHGELGRGSLGTAALLLERLHAEQRTLEAMDVYRTVLEADRELTVQERAAPVRVAVAAISLIESRVGARRAEPLWRAIVGDRELHLVNSTPYGTAGLLHDLGRVLWAQRKYAEAEPVYRQAAEIRLRTAGPDHFSTGWSMVWLGRTLLELQRADEAALWFERALPVYVRSIGPDDAETMRVRDNLAEAVDESSGKSFTRTAPSYPAVPGSR